MKISLLFSVFYLLGINLAISQFNWTEVPYDIKEEIHIIHQTKDDEIVGWARNGSALFVSTDYGNSWQLLYKGYLGQDNSVVSNAILYSGLIRKGVDGYYTAIDGDLYRISSSSSIELFIDFDTVWNPVDFFFLSNGNLFVLKDNKLFLFDSTGNLVKEQAKNNSGSSYFIQGIADTHYLFGDSNYTVFNTDMSVVDEDIPRPDPTLHRVKESPSGGLFSYENYSLDGYNWSAYPDGRYGDVAITNDGKILIFTQDETIYVSADNATTFEEKSIPNFEYNGIDEFIRYQNSGIALVSKNCSSAFKFSHDGYSDWQKKAIVIDEGAEIQAWKLSVANEDNLFVENCASTYYKTSTANSFKEFQFTNAVIDKCHSTGGFKALPDGNWINFAGCLSTNEGENFLGGIDESFASGFNWIYESGVYFLGKDEIYRSGDSGSTWERIEWINGDIPLVDNVSFNAPITTIVSNLEYVYVFDAYNIHQLSLDGVLRNSIGLQQEWIPYGIYSSFGGSEIVVYFKWNGDNYLLIHDEITGISEYKITPGENSQQRSWRIKIDQASNIYLFNDESLYYSVDNADTWKDITPQRDDLIKINDMDIGWDGHIYLATYGTPILRSSEPVFNNVVNTQELESEVISIFPNPAQRELKIMNEGKENLEHFELYSLDGSLVLSDSLEESNSINISTVPMGIYILRVSLTGGKHFRQKIIITN